VRPEVVQQMAQNAVKWANILGAALIPETPAVPQDHPTVIGATPDVAPDAQVETPVTASVAPPVAVAAPTYVAAAPAVATTPNVAAAPTNGSGQSVSAAPPTPPSPSLPTPPSVQTSTATTAVHTPVTKQGSAAVAGDGSHEGVSRPDPMRQTDFLQASVGELRRIYALIVGLVATGVGGVFGFVRDNPWVIVALIAGVVVLVVFYIHVQRDLDKERMRLAADPNSENVR
jgi:hypothetical protein